MHWRSQSSREIFFCLLANTEGLKREKIIETVWKQDPDPSSGNRFRVAVHRIRAAMGWPEAVRDIDLHYKLDDEIINHSDIGEFRSLLKQAQQGEAEERLVLYRRAFELYGNDYLFDTELDFAAHLRAEYKSQLIRGELEAVDLLECAGKFSESIALLEKVLNQDPFLGEDLHQKLIADLAQERGKYAAIEHYRRFALFLKDEIGDSPLPETLAMVEKIREMKPSAEAPLRKVVVRKRKKRI